MKEHMNEKDADKYIQYSFKRNFHMNCREVELFEPPKVLGDVFEALMGAIFMDGGIKKVLEVYQHLLSPFILFTAKYSKKLYRVPKDEFNSMANLHMIKPTMRIIEIEVDSIDGFISQLGTNTDPEHAYVVSESKAKQQLKVMLAGDL